MSSIETYIATDPAIAYSCPPEVSENDAWQTKDMSATVGDTTARVTTGAGCTASFKFTGISGMIQGSTNPNGTSWGCSIDGGTTWTYFTTGKTADGNWGVGILCGYGLLEESQEHQLMIKNSPAGGTQLVLDSFQGGGSGSSTMKLTTSNQVTYLTIAAPQTTDWASTTSTSTASSQSPTTSSTGPTASSVTSVSSSESSSSSLSTTISSSSSSDSSSSVASSTGIFITIAVALLGIVVACAIATICLRTKPKPGREEAGLLARRQRVKQLEEAEAADVQILHRLPPPPLTAQNGPSHRLSLVFLQVFTRPLLLYLLPSIDMSIPSQFGFTTTAEEAAAHYSGNIEGKVVAVTGVTPNGLGAEAARVIAKHNPKLLILAGRNLDKINETIAAIQKEAPSVDTKPLILDLSSLEATRKAAEEVLSWNIAIDVLINNAGVMALKNRTLSTDGNEMQFATNHVGPFLFTNLILPALRRSPSPRVVSVSSWGHHLSPFRADDPNFEQDGSYDQWKAYGQSKTSNMLFAVALSKRGIPAISLHPGAIYTNLMRHMNDEDKVAMGLMNPDGTPVSGGQWTFKSLEQGVSTHIVAAFEPSLQAQGGVYLDDCQIQKDREDYAVDPEVAEKLWKVSEKLVGQTFA
ncbi:hypothetical protein JCM1840_004443 [Sporobolomyces johnsonii]